MNNFLVIGGFGQLGKCIKYISKENKKINFFFPTKKEVNIIKKDTINEFCKKNRIDGIINCAAYTNVEKAELDTDLVYKINVLGVKNCLDITEKFKLKFIHISTDYVFDGKKNENYIENDIKNPTCVYGLSKSDAEDLIIKSNSQSIIIRTSWLFSPFGKNFIKTILKKDLEKKNIKVVSDQFGNPTYGIDLAKIISYLILDFKLLKNKIYHFTNSGKTSWFNLANKIKNNNRLKLIIEPIKSSKYKSRVNRPKNSSLSTILIEKTLNLKIQSWELALKDCLNLIKK